MGKGCRKYFSLIEILVSIAIIAILIGLLLPAFSKGKTKATFVRWLAFNRQCSSDPACVVNLNFQQGEGKITNSAAGDEFKGFSGDRFKGKLIGDCEWTDGRWPGKKSAILFPGHFSFVEISAGPSGAFGTFENFTIILWVCFDFPSSAGPLLSKGLLQYSKPNYFGQYFLTERGWWNKDKSRCTAAFDVQASGYKARFGDKNVDGKKISYARHEWVMLTIRNYIKNDEKVVDFFVKGEKMERKYVEIQAETIKIPSVIWLGGMKYQRFGSNNPVPDHQQSGFGFKGRIDEMLMYRRALSDSKVKGHYEMGRVN